MIERMNKSKEQSKSKIKKVVDDWKEQLNVLEEKEKERREKVKKILAEQERQANERAKKLKEEQELTKAQEDKEYISKLKNGKIFVHQRRTFNFKEITKLLELITGNVGYFNDEKQLLDGECKEDISNTFTLINQELKAIKEEITGIEKCLNLPEKSHYINWEQEKKDLVLAKQLVKDLESCQEELCNLLETV